MMLLAIDIGNTNTVFAVYDGETLKAHWRCQTVAARTSDEYASFLKPLFLLAKIEWQGLDDVIVASVVPDADFNIKKFSQDYLKHKPLLVTSADIPIKIDLKNPEEVGADRLINAYAIQEFYKSPAIVIDFGTATTFDVIDEKGRYAGGAIAPGLNLSVEALRRAAAKLPKVKIQKPKSVVGKNTVEAIQSGMFFGYLGLIEGIVQNISKEMGVKPFVLATGGLATLFEPHTKTIQKVDDELTLKGLVHLYQSQHKNKTQKRKK